jgi:hypothetical protein
VEHLSGQKVVFDDVFREIADQEAAIIVLEEHRRRAVWESPQKGWLLN